MGLGIIFSSTHVEFQEHGCFSWRQRDEQHRTGLSEESSIGMSQVLNGEGHYISKHKTCTVRNYQNRISCVMQLLATMTKYLRQKLIQKKSLFRLLSVYGCCDPTFWDSVEAQDSGKELVEEQSCSPYGKQEAEGAGIPWSEMFLMTYLLRAPPPKVSTTAQSYHQLSTDPATHDLIDTITILTNGVSYILIDSTKQSQYVSDTGGTKFQ